MQGAIRREVGNRVDAIASADSYLSWAASGKINQATIVADSVGFARYTEAAIAAGDLKALAEKVSKKLFALTTMARDQSLEKLQRNLVNTLIVRTMYQENVVDKLIKQEVTSTESESWTNVLRHYWEDGVKVRCGDKELDYGYEYSGSGQMLVVTQLSEDCFLHHIKNFCEGRGVAAYGPAGTGKTETVKDCAKLIGVPCFVVKEGGDLKVKFHIVDTNAWVCFDEFNRLSAEDVKIAQEVMSGKGSFFTYNPGFEGRTDVSGVPLAGIEMFYPPYGLINEAHLYFEGIHEGEKLGATLVAIAEECNEKLSNKDLWSKTPLRQLKAIVVATGALTRKYGDDLDDTASMFNILRKLAGIAEEDTVIYAAIVNKHFPDSKVFDE